MPCGAFCSRGARSRGTYFRRPGTLLLPISIRIPVLAGIARVASRPDRLAERLLGAVAETARPGLAECFIPSPAEDDSMRDSPTRC